MLTNREFKQIIVESLAFVNSNSQHQRVIRHLKARSTLTEEWTWDRDILNSESNNYDNTLIVEGIQRNEIWQMNVFHFVESGKFKYIHYTIDTYSEFQWATALNSVFWQDRFNNYIFIWSYGHHGDNNTN